MMKTTVLTIMLLAAVTALHPAGGPYARCLDDPPSNAGPCTANDVRISEVVLINGPSTCVIGEDVTITGRAHLVSTAQTRYDIGSYVALDGGDARSGRCYSNYLHPLGTGSAIDITGGKGPFKVLESSNKADLCGDIVQGEDQYQDLEDITFKCLDHSSNGQADFKTCSSWYQQAGPFCNGMLDAIPGSPAKCRCGVTEIIGLNVCIYDQATCTSHNLPGATCTSTQACNNVWSARAVITGGSASTLFNEGTLTFANVYYDFSSANEFLGWELLDPSAFSTPWTIGQFSSAAILQEAVQSPCEVVRAVKCSGTCSLINDARVIPRFFHDTSDTAGIPAGVEATLPAAMLTQCPLRFTKNSAVTGGELDQVQYLLLRCAGGRIVPCGARTFDGTLYEFFTENGQYGVNLGTTAPKQFNALTADYSFQAVRDQCAGQTAVCSEDVSNLFVMDEQASITTSGFTAMKSYVSTTVDGFSEQPLIQFGAYWAGAAEQDPVGFQNNHASFKASVTGRARVNPIPAETDFYATIQNAINAYWPSAPSGAGDPPRNLVTLAGGVQSTSTPRSSAEWAALRNFAASRGVKLWAIGFGAGENLAFLKEISTQDPNSVFPTAIPLGNSDSLALDAPYMPLRLCPAASDVCGGTCAGLCACANNCVCPVCVSDKCTDRTCDPANPQLGCVATPKASCTSTDPCAPLVCDPTSTADPPCVPGTAPDCNDNNPCTLDSCVQGVGCQNVPFNPCDDNDFCTDDVCVDNVGCQYTFNLARCPDTQAPTTGTPTTSAAPTTGSPTSQAPTSIAPTSQAPTSQAPTSLSPTTGVPTNMPGVPVSQAPTSLAPTSQAPTTGVPTSLSPTSQAPTTAFPTSASPTNTPAPTIPPSNPCVANPCPASTACVKNECVLDATVPAGYRCVATPRITCPAGDMCSSFTCVSDGNTPPGPKCEATPLLTCTGANACNNRRCDPLLGCVDVPVDCPSTSLCDPRVCNPATGQCEDGPKLQCNDFNTCTNDVCRPQRGCVFEPILCNTSSPCNVLEPCVNGSSTPCVEKTLATLLDFCGTCGGDNVACFFKDSNDLAAAVGIAGGVIAAIAISAVVALLLGLFLSKKGYDAYVAKSQGMASAATQSPLFKTNENRGSFSGIH